MDGRSAPGCAGSGRRTDLVPARPLPKPLHLRVKAAETDKRVLRARSSKKLRGYWENKVLPAVWSFVGLGGTGLKLVYYSKWALGTVRSYSKYTQFFGRFMYGYSKNVQ